MEPRTIDLLCTRLFSDHSLPHNDSAGEVDLGRRPSGHTTSDELPQGVFKTVLHMRARLPPLPNRTLRTQMDEMPKHMQEEAQRQLKGILCNDQLLLYLELGTISGRLCI